MSHVATVAAMIKDFDALEQAAKAVGGELKRGQTSFLMWGSRREPCLHAITIAGAPKGSYEVGLRQSSATDAGKDTFDFACDFYDGRITKAFGSNLVNLRNEYLAVVAENELQRGGYRVQREQVGQQIHLVAIQ